MRLSELLGSEVVDAAGRRVGLVRDCRIRVADGSWEVAGLVLGEGMLDRAAHACGLGAGRASGPWPLRTIAARVLARGLFVSAEDVSVWGAARVELSVDRRALTPLPELVPA